MTATVPAATSGPCLTSRAALLSSLHSRIRACAPKRALAASAAAAAPPAFAPVQQHRAVASLTLMLPAEPQQVQPQRPAAPQQPEDLPTTVERCYSLRQLNDVLGSHGSLMALEDAAVSTVVVRTRQLLQWSGHMASNKLLKSLSRKLAAALVQLPEPLASLRPNVLLQALPLLADLGHVASQQWVVAACVGLLQAATGVRDKELAQCFLALQRMTGGLWLVALQQALETHAFGTPAGGVECIPKISAAAAAAASASAVGASAPAESSADAALLIAPGYAAGAGAGAVSPVAAVALLCSLAGISARPSLAVLDHLAQAVLGQQRRQQQQQQACSLDPGRFTQALEALARMGWQPTAAVTQQVVQHVDEVIMQPALAASARPGSRQLHSQLQRTLWALARLQAHLPAPMQHAVLHAFHGRMHLLAPKQQCSLIYALVQLGCRPSPTWMQHWEAATVGSLSSLGMHLHVSVLRSLAGMGYLPSSSWMRSWEAATQGLLSMLSTAHLADVAQSMAALRHTPSLAWREAFWAACSASSVRTATRIAGATAPDLPPSSTGTGSSHSSAGSLISSCGCAVAGSATGMCGSCAARAAALQDTVELVCAVAAAPGLQQPTGAPPAWAGAVAAVMNSCAGAAGWYGPVRAAHIPDAQLARLVWSAARLELKLERPTLLRWAVQFAAQAPPVGPVSDCQPSGSESGALRPPQQEDPVRLLRQPLARQQRLQQQQQQQQRLQHQHQYQQQQQQHPTPPQQLLRLSPPAPAEAAKQVALALAGLAALGAPPEQQWLAPLEARTAALLPACDAQALTDLAWAYGKLRHCPGRAWRHAFYGRSLLLMERGSVTAASLANVARALGALQLKPPPRWRAVYYRLTAALLLPKQGSVEHLHWDAAQLAVASWALARACVVPPPAWLLAWRVAVARQLRNMGAMPLTNVLWAAARWRRALTWCMNEHGISTVEGEAGDDNWRGNQQGRAARREGSGSGRGKHTAVIAPGVLAAQEDEAEWLERLLMQIQWHLHSCGPAHLAAVICAAGDLPLQAPISWLDAAYDAVMAQLPAFNAPQLVSVLEALHKLEHVLSERRMEAILSRFERLMRMGAVAPHSLARALKALAHISWAEPSDAWLAAALKTAGEQLSGCGRAPGGQLTGSSRSVAKQPAGSERTHGMQLGLVAQQLAALAELGVRQPQCGSWAGSFLAATRPQLPRAAGGDICTLAWAIAQLGWAPSRAYSGALLLALWRRMRTLSPRELALVGMGIAGLHLLPHRAWHARYLARAQQLAKQFSSEQDWASVAWALRHMQHRGRRRCHRLLRLQPRRLLKHTGGPGATRAAWGRAQHSHSRRAVPQMQAAAKMQASGGE